MNEGEKRQTLAFAALYCSSLLLLLGRRPLWLDEVHQLIGTRGTTWRECVQWIVASPGGPLLPYLTQKLTLDTFGFSTFTARLSAALCGALNLLLFYRIARLLRITYPLIALIIFASVPLVFRYNIEARPYSQALTTALLTLLLLLRLRSKVTPNRVALYSLACLLALYTQPFTLFFIAGQGSWAIIFGRAEKRFARACLIALASAALLYLPWSIYVRQMNLATGATGGFHFAWSQVNPILILRELAGGNFAVTLPLLVLVVLGWRKAQLKDAHKKLLGALALSSLFLPICFDVTADFFFASRQLIFLQPVFALLAAEGCAALKLERRNRLAVTMLSLLFMAAWAKNYRQAFGAGEDWEAAAAQLTREVSSGNCFVFAPTDHLLYYSVFQPALRTRLCSSADTEASTETLVISPYTPAAAAEQARRNLRANDWELQETQRVGSTAIERYTQR